jgi:hypothetical protein
VSQTADPRTDLGGDQRGGSPDLPTLERQVLDYWASDDTFCASIARRDGAPEYVMYDGPPFGKRASALRPPAHRLCQGHLLASAFLAQGGRTTMITPAEGAHAFQSRLHRNRSYTGYAPATGMPWLTALAGRSPFRRGIPSHGRAEPNGTTTFCAELDLLFQDELPTRLRCLVAEQVGLIPRRTTGSASAATPPTRGRSNARCGGVGCDTPTGRGGLGVPH